MTRYLFKPDGTTVPLKAFRVYDAIGDHIRVVTDKQFDPYYPWSGKELRWIKCSSETEAKFRASEGVIHVPTTPL